MNYKDIFVTNNNDMNMITRYISFIILPIVTSCATNPVSGIPDFVTITEQQEISIGASYHEKILEENKVIQNKELNDYFQKLGESISEKSHRPELKWHFTLIDDPTFNAFATPGGYVYMYRGMLNYFNSEAEFAGVIGHEIGHITARHAVRGMSTSQVTALLLSILQTNVPGGQLTGNAFNLVNVIINRGYGRKFELEADQLGEEYLERSNYDPSAMAAFLQTLKYSEELEKKIAEEEGREANIGYHGIFSTHPDHEKRINALGNTISEKTTRKNNKEKFLKLLDGSVYGSSPEEGYVKNSIFYHPILAIKFKIEDGWEFKNNPDQLVVQKDKDVMTFTVDELLLDDLENGLTPEKYLKEGVQKTSFLTTNKLISSEDFSYNGLTGYSHLYHSKSIINSSYIRFTIIFDTKNEKKKPKAWIIRSNLSDLTNDDKLKVMLKSFSKMSNKEVKDSKGLTIKVIRFREGMSYENLAKSSPLGKYALDKLRLLNGHYPSGNPIIGDLIKIVQ
ncbi:MAG: M48 family metalloprotease [Gammaproteobacteria bacterium]|nr:M48 family metalloprotease [Gammaproteobacteria bacterium]